jgi:LacI family transcriptional regulator
MIETLKTPAKTTRTPKHKYRKLADVLREQIMRRELQPGDRLPSFMELRTRHGVTLSTVERVYGLLENEGLVERRHGSGTFVAEPGNRLTGSIGFIGGALVNLSQNPFNVRIAEGVRQAAGLKRQHLLYMGTDYSLNLEGCEKVDGVLICNIEDVAPVVNRLPVLMPRVSLLTVIAGMTSVVADDYHGARMATEDLLGLGHRRIACLMEQKPSIPRRRFAGYCDAMHDAGVTPDARWVRLTGPADDKNVEQPYLQWGRLQMRQWIENGWRESGCTSILVQNEVSAIGVMQILQEARIRVPADVSVMGFDGTEICDLITPPLTAMALPLTQIGVKSVEMLNRQIAGEQATGEVIMLPMNLRQGGSVAAPGT